MVYQTKRNVKDNYLAFDYLTQERFPGVILVGYLGLKVGYAVAKLASLSFLKASDKSLLPHSTFSAISLAFFNSARYAFVTTTTSGEVKSLTYGDSELERVIRLGFPGNGVALTGGLKRPIRCLAGLCPLLYLNKGQSSFVHCRTSEGFPAQQSLTHLCLMARSGVTVLLAI